MTKTGPKLLSALGQIIEGGEDRHEQLSISSFKVLFYCPGSIKPFPPTSKEREAFAKTPLPFLAAACLWM